MENNPHSLPPVDPTAAGLPPPPGQATPRVEPISAETAARFIARRLKPQLQWFERKARRAKRLHMALATTQIVATASIPVVNILTKSLDHAVVVTTVLAAIATAATAFSTMMGFQDQWIHYRQAARNLEALHLRYELGLAPFAGADRHHLLVEQIEWLLSSESGNWQAMMQAKAKAASASKAERGEKR